MRISDFSIQMSTYTVDEGQNDCLRKRTWAVGRHHNLSRGPRKQLAKLARILSPKNGEISVVPLLARHRRRSVPRDGLCGLRDRRRDGGMRRLRCCDALAEPVWSVHLRLLLLRLLRGRRRLLLVWSVRRRVAGRRLAQRRHVDLAELCHIPRANLTVRGPGDLTKQI